MCTVFGLARRERFTKALKHQVNQLRLVFFLFYFTMDGLAAAICFEINNLPALTKKAIEFSALQAHVAMRIMEQNQ